MAPKFKIDAFQNYIFNRLNYWKIFFYHGKYKIIRKCRYEVCNLEFCHHSGFFGMTCHVLFTMLINEIAVNNRSAWNGHNHTQNNLLNRKKKKTKKTVENCDPSVSWTKNEICFVVKSNSYTLKLCFYQQVGGWCMFVMGFRKYKKIERLNL